jgi:hypothetical protein
VAAIAKILRFLRQQKTTWWELSRAEKNGTRWYRLRIGNWSLMFGRKV